VTSFPALGASSDSHWLIEFLASFSIGQIDYFAFGFTNQSLTKKKVAVMRAENNIPQCKDKDLD